MHDGGIATDGIARQDACLCDKRSGHVVAEVLQVDWGLLWELHGVHLAPTDNIVFRDASLGGLVDGGRVLSDTHTTGCQQGPTHHSDLGLGWMKGGGPCKDVGLDHTRILGSGKVHTPARLPRVDSTCATR